MPDPSGVAVKTANAAPPGPGVPGPYFRTSRAFFTTGSFALFRCSST